MGIVQTFLNCFYYHHVSPSKQADLQRKRLQRLVKHAKKYSPYIRELYQSVGDDFTLTDLPVTSKQMIMGNFDRWVTDPDVTFDNVKTFLADEKNNGALYRGKYIMATTSGSTGFPLIFAIDKTSRDVYCAESILLKIFTHRPICMLYPTKMPLIAVSLFKENLIRFPFIRKSMHLIDVMLPTAQLVEQLNRIQPKTLYAYPSTMEILADECLSGRLRINVKEVICASEMLTPKAKAYIEEVFQCKARSIYGCTEGGNIAYTCSEGHHHLNNSWNIIEAVDVQNNPVPDGQKADKILLTNLSNMVVPIIRYEVTDSVIIHNEPCACGSHQKWIELEGRTGSEPLVFRKGAEEIRIAATLFHILVESMDTIRQFQLILHGSDRFECRIRFMPGVDEAVVFDDVKHRILSLLKENDINGVEVYLSDQSPQVDPVTLKFKCIYQEKN